MSCQKHATVVCPTCGGDDAPHNGGVSGPLQARVNDRRRFVHLGMLTPAEALKVSV